VALPAFTAERRCLLHGALLQARRAEIDRCLLSAGLSAANLQQRRAAGER